PERTVVGHAALAPVTARKFVRRIPVEAGLLGALEAGDRIGKRAGCGARCEQGQRHLERTGNGHGNPTGEGKWPGHGELGVTANPGVADLVRIQKNYRATPSVNLFVGSPPRVANAASTGARVTPHRLRWSALGESATLGPDARARPGERAGRTDPARGDAAADAVPA